jgi:hypothetical protein
MRLRWPKVTIGAGFAVALILSLIVYRLPQGREVIAHYRCEKREEQRVQALGRLVDETLRNGQSTKTDVREFLKAHFSNVPVVESSREIAAGPMLFSFDENGKMKDLLHEIPCSEGF